jgi:pyridoxal phosphate enzyme (YggS family)
MSIRENLRQINQRIEAVCARVKRHPGDVLIMGVVKDQDSLAVREAYDAGLRIFGENRMQEAEVHQAELADLDIEWHFIGKLQKNKINKVLRSFHRIQTVDGVKNIEHIQKRITDPVEVFLEINAGDEKSKSGFTIDGLLKALPYISTLNRVVIKGLMTIPPVSEDPEESRPFFRSLRELADEINAKPLQSVKIEHLSMGMSHDFEVAVEEGATMVRIGTALFGRRG